MPRSLNICTAAGESASEMRTFDPIWGLNLGACCFIVEAQVASRWTDGKHRDRLRASAVSTAALGQAIRLKSQAARASASLLFANAQSSQAVSAWRSARSTVEPHQIRKPAGASR